MESLIRKMYQLCFLICAAAISAFVIWLLIHHQDSYGRQYSPEKKRAMHPSPPKKFLTSEPSALTIGKYRNLYCNLPFLKSPVHQLVLGAPGLGKSTMILTALLNHFHPDNSRQAEMSDDFYSAIIVDCKPELIRRSVDERRTDLVRIVNPSDIDSPYGFDVFYGMNRRETHIDDIKSRCTDISSSLIKQSSGDNAYFSSNARSLLTGFLMYEFLKGNTFIDAVTRARSLPAADYIATIISDPEIENFDPQGKVRAMVSRFDGQDNDSFQSITNELTTNLDVFDKDSVRKCFSREDHVFTPDDLLKGISLDLAIPDAKMDEYSYVFGLIINLCCKHLMAQDEYNRRDPRPYYLILDEGGTIYVPILENAVARGRSKGLQVLLVAQSYQELETLYGPKKAATISDCCDTQILLSCTNRETAEAYSKRCGQYLEPRASSSHQNLSLLNGSQSNSSEYRPIWDVADIYRLADTGEALVFNRGRWFCVKKCPYYKISKYKEISDKVYQINKKLEGKQYVQIS